MSTPTTPNPETPIHTPGQGSLVSAADAAAFEAGRARPKAPSRDWSRMTVGEAWASVAAGWAQPGVRRLAVVLALILAIGLPLWAYFELRTRPAPDYALDDIGDVLDYTLLSDDFNRLPIDQRMALIKDLVNRLKSMSAGDSELMAAFAAGITGKAREQLRTNAERLAVDLWDSYSERYGDIPTEQRGEFLDNAFLEFTKLMEDVAGVENPKTDNERLADARRQAKRDSERASQNLGPIPEQAGRMVKALHDRGEKVTTPVQRARITRFTRDMVRHLRDQDLNTAKPRSPAGAPSAPKPARPTDPSSPQSPEDPQDPEDKPPADEDPEKNPPEKTPPEKKPVDEKPAPPAPPGGG